MSFTSPDTETSCSKMNAVAWYIAIVILSMFLFYPTIFFLGGPYCYFIWLLMEKDLNKLYLAEGIRLSGSVLERPTHTSSISIGCDSYTVYQAKVLYEAPGGGMYVKNCAVVTGDKLAQTNIELIVLPQYPASAIQYSRVDPLGDRLPSAIIDSKTSLLPVSFVWVLVTCYQLSGFLLSRVLLNVWAVALIIVCEVCISFVLFFFVIDKLQQQGLYNIEFDATPYDESQEVQQPRPYPPMPHITYQEIFPHGSYTFFSILQSIVIDFLKVCVFALGIFLMIALGAGLWCTYITNGTIVEGKVVHRFALGWKARVQYAVIDISTSKILRYEKTIPGAHRIAGRQVQIPDDPRLYILHPNLPCSARFADEIELHDKIYEFNKWVKMTFYIVYLALQQSVCVWLLFFKFPTAWSLSIISTCAIVLGVQLFVLWGFASLRPRHMVKDMVHNATQLFDVESDISFKAGATDNTLTLGDSTTTSEDGLDLESSLLPKICMKF
ncbi:hypothetical protein FRACYDRAFT_233309 [Fragilariopsis cylindrus CCMP1102]|uniref:Uncharacterized protein n=1 Tax=Fragilariopsis cylindrus CCMP1102 TaxID=635003 RepID=A0A1E7FYB2_9STRA|nr:hypothetical protein FRACYDRAFT_233309 [Fragilariopsis cylindrus CCMP1102]|eukprot:OEU23141.1 hypothetical protein FRACYDRAFT_233309 [Fragilariopsis cylindrus CCMP1102]